MAQEVVILMRAMVHRAVMQVADEQTTGGLYVTEADAHGTAATFAGLEARHRRGRGVGDDRGDPEEPRAPQGPPTLEDVLAYSLGHVGFLRWGVAVVFDYQVKRREYMETKKSTIVSLR